MSASFEPWYGDGFLLGAFANDMPGVYSRLDSEHRTGFIDRTAEFGVGNALEWVEEIAPEIFRSHDFKPQGVSREQWTNWVGTNQ